jgi:hypothetical protein
MRARTILLLLLLGRSALASHNLTPPTFGPTTYDYGPPLVATNGSSFLAVWLMNTARAAGSATGTHTYGSLAGPGGNLLTPTAFLIAPRRIPVGVFSTGRDYVALLRSDDYSNSKLQVAFISGNDHAVRLGPTVSFALNPRGAAFNGDRFFVIGTDGSNRPAAYVMGTDGRIIAGPILTDRASRVVADGSDFVTAAGDGDTLSVQRFTAGGAPRAASTVIAYVTGSPSSTLGVAITAKSGVVTVAWQRALDSFHSDLGVAVIRPDGSTSVQRQTIARAGSEVTLVATASGHLVIGTHYGGNSWSSFAVRVDSNGRMIDPPLSIETPSITPVFSAAAIGDVVFTSGLIPSATTLRVTAGGIEAGGPVDLSVVMKRQAAPRIASDGTEQFVSWSDEARGDDREAAIRLTATGLRIDPDQTDLGPSSAAYSGAVRQSHSIAFGRSVALVVWLDGGVAVARRFSREGLLDAQPIVLGPAGSISDQAIAWDGTRFMVVWYSKSKILSATVTEQGAASAARELLTVYYGDNQPRIVWDGARFILTWMLYQYYGSPYHGYYPSGVGIARLVERRERRRAVVASGGLLIDSVTYDSMASLSGTIPSWHLASSGHEVLLVGDRSLDLYSGGPHQVLSAVIHTGGPSLEIDPPATLFEWIGQTASDVVWDGTSYVVAWRYGSDATGWWLATARSFAGGPPANALAAQAAAADLLAPPAISPSGAGSVIAISEPPAIGDPARVRIYTAADLHPMMAPPATPAVEAIHVGTTMSITWEAPASDVTGFVVEALYPGASEYSSSVVPGGARSFVVSFLAQSVRVRAVNAGGFSAPSAPVTPIKLRHHEARH